MCSVSCVLVPTSTFGSQCNLLSLEIRTSSWGTLNPFPASTAVLNPDLSFPFIVSAGNRPSPGDLQSRWVLSPTEQDLRPCVSAEPKKPLQAGRLLQHLRVELSWSFLESLAHASSRTAKGSNSPSPGLQDHFRAIPHSSCRSTAACVSDWCHSHLLFSAWLSSCRNYAIPCPPLTSSSFAAPHLQLWKAMNTKRQPALQDPVTNSIHAYLSFWEGCRLAFSWEQWGSQRRLSLLSLRTLSISETWKSLKGLSPAFAIHCRNRNIKDDAWTTCIRKVAATGFHLATSKQLVSLSSAPFLPLQNKVIAINGPVFRED